jgi:hypothetical protein
MRLFFIRYKTSSKQKNEFYGLNYTLAAFFIG